MRTFVVLGEPFAEIARAELKRERNANLGCSW